MLSSALIMLNYADYKDKRMQVLLEAEEMYDENFTADYNRSIETAIFIGYLYHNDQKYILTDISE